MMPFKQLGILDWLGSVLTGSGVEAGSPPPRHGYFGLRISSRRAIVVSQRVGFRDGFAELAAKERKEGGETGIEAFLCVLCVLFRRFRSSAIGSRTSDFGLRTLALALALLASPASSAPSPAAAAAPAPPSTPREFFNAGTRKMGEGKWREAEAFFESALASQVEKLQPPALYNLGHVRFIQGFEEMRKAPLGGPVADHGQKAMQSGDQAIRHIDEALAGNDIQRMVNSYLEGQGARRELREATAAVRRALEACRATLTKWQRASDDFKSAAELDPADADARANAEFVDGCIAKLVDMIMQLEQSGKAMGDKKSELGEKMKQLGGRIPAPQMPPGAAGDDEDEDEDQPFGPQPGQKEGPNRQGVEIFLSPEQAGWLLDSFKLGGDRRLPMGQGDSGQPKDKPRKTW
jgi:tetratricopeptide (TPR) repeat protein